jgi:hypothetical protein
VLHLDDERAHHDFRFRVVRFVRWVAPWLAVFAMSCASKPTMRLNHAEISGVDVATSAAGIGVLMTVFLDVHNPNSYDVALRAMRGQVVLADKYSLAVDFRPPGDGLWLPSARTTSVRVPIHLPLDLVLALLRETIAAPSFDFRLTGRADVTATRAFRFEKDDYSVDERGSISRAQVAAIIPASLAPTH